jgi:hypothetical protein
VVCVYVCGFGLLTNVPHAGSIQVANSHAPPFRFTCSNHPSAALSVSRDGQAKCKVGGEHCQVLSTPNIPVRFFPMDGAMMNFVIRSEEIARRLFPGIDLKVYYSKPTEYFKYMSVLRYVGTLLCIWLCFTF